MDTHHPVAWKRHKEAGPILYFGGFAYPPKIEAWLAKTVGWKYRCVTYATAEQKRSQECIDICRENGVSMFLDSGAFSLQKKAFLAKINLDQFTENYAAYVESTRRDWDFYVNVDYVRHAPTAFKMMERLWSWGLKPMPVYHGDSSVDWFQRYVDHGCKLIGIAFMEMPQTLIYRALKRVFALAEKNKVSLHGFGLSGEYMATFPWYSVDSTTWFASCKYGEIIIADARRNKLRRVHITERPTKMLDHRFQIIGDSQVQRIISQAESYGLDFRDMQKQQHVRAAWNALTFRDYLSGRIKATS